MSAPSATCITGPSPGPTSRPTTGRIPDDGYLARPWRLLEFSKDLHLEDVWSLPIGGRADDFDEVVSLFTGGTDLAGQFSAPARVVWVLRDRVGSLLGLGGITTPAVDRDQWAPIAGTVHRSLRDRLPDDLGGTVEGVRFEDVPFVPVYRTSDEFVAELANRTVHAVMHITWVHDGDGRYHAEMAAYATPRGVLGRAYMALITPFRRWVVYPSLLSALERAWSQR